MPPPLEPVAGLQDSEKRQEADALLGTQGQLCQLVHFSANLTCGDKQTQECERNLREDPNPEECESYLRNDPRL